MQFITLDEGKAYLRVDSDYEDAVITALLTSAEILCSEIARLTDDDWQAVCAETTEEDSVELQRNRALMRTAILYTLGYLYEHREEADHHDLVLTLRSILFSIREGVI